MTTDIDDLVAGTLETAREQLAMDIGYFSEFVGDQQVIRAVQGDAASFGLVPDTQVPLADSYCQRVVDGRLPSLVADTLADPRTAALPATAAADIGAYVGVPLELPDGSLYGTLCCASHDPRPGAGERDVRFMRILARTLAEHLQREAEAARFNAQLARVNAELAAFAQVAAHDLVEPMRTVSGLLQLLAHRRGEGLLSEDREIVDAVVAEAGRMETLVDGLLALARAGGKGEHVAVDLGAIAREAIEAVRASADSDGATIRVAGLPHVLGDPTQLRQLVQNLVANALRYRSAAPALVHIDARAVAGVWEVAVTDNGIGVPEDERERIFLALTRGAGARDRPGTGLGLATCAKIVDGHGGRLWVEPAAGGGSRFAFTLRAAA